MGSNRSLVTGGHRARRGGWTPLVAILKVVLLVVVLLPSPASAAEEVVGEADGQGGADDGSEAGDEAAAPGDGEGAAPGDGADTEDGSTDAGADAEGSPEVEESRDGEDAPVEDEETETQVDATADEGGEPADQTDVAATAAASEEASEHDEEVTVAPAAAGPPEYEMDGRWISPPAAVASGEPVVADWRFNVNDSGEPPSNDPVDNVTAEFTIGNGYFDELPDACLTDGVDPASSISADGLTLTCNLGTVDMGTAVAVQTAIVADGDSGDEVQLTGSYNGLTEPLRPIPIVNSFGMDILWDSPTNQRRYDPGGAFVDMEFNWTLFINDRSEDGPDSITYTLDVGSTSGGDVAVDPTRACQEFTTAGAIGHPWSGGDHPAEQMAPFVDSCTLTETSPGVFELTLTGIDYSRVQVPVRDSARGLMPTDRDAVASGSVWFRVSLANGGGTVLLDSDEPTYMSVSGQAAVDDASNNESSKAFTVPGGGGLAWTYWHPGFTGTTAGAFDTNYRVSPGTTAYQQSEHYWNFDDATPDAQYGICHIQDTRYVTFNEVTRISQSPGPDITAQGTVEYYTGNSALVDPASTSYDPDTFNCGSDPAGWTTTAPTTDAEKATVRAVRITYPYSAIAGVQGSAIFQNNVTVHDDVAPGQDIWSFGNTLRNGTWITSAAHGDDQAPTPGRRYSAIKQMRTLMEIVVALPNIQKDVDRTTVVPGDPAVFTLTYSADGSGDIPETVDDYTITDTLPVGMTYEPGSASPEPVVTVNGSGQQVLTWTLDGVPTNTLNTLTYEAVADSSVEPGTRLVNIATSSLSGETSPEAGAVVTSAVNGYTTILKTPDVEYIPNDAGNGVGQGSWTVTVDSFDPLSQAFTDTIDILPYNGDQRGTSFSGAYSLDDVVLPDGGTVYYTDADPASLSDDPADPTNGTAGDPTGNTVGWTTVQPANPTAIRVIGPELVPGGEFSFQVVITTDGASLGDVYVNRAQARAEHTELVMRTSAPLVVTDYVVEKTSNPPSGSTVGPGDVVEYMITVTQQGDVPGDAFFTDTLTEVFDDAVYNGDLTADIGTATLTGDVLSWEGMVPVGGVAHITYSVTVNDIEGLEAEGDTVMTNAVSSPGCRLPEDCRTELLVGWYEYSKTSDPVPGSTVQVGEEVTYKVQVTQRGEGAIEGAIVGDDLTAVLDDAAWNDDAQATAGEVTFEAPNLTWTGDLAVGDVVDLIYSVTVADDGDFELANVVTSPDEMRSRCVPAPDENPNCMTTHYLGDYETVKTSDPVSGSEVDAGDEVVYTVTVRHVGLAPVPDAWFDDELSEVLDDATYNGDAEASKGDTVYAEPMLSWTGELEPGEVVTVTYSVTVTSDGDRHLLNVVTTGGQCVPADGQDEACTTEHFDGAFVYAKTSDPAPGTEVEPGDVVTYTVTVEPVGSAPVAGASIEDDLTGVLDDATFNGDHQASAGTVTHADATLRWAGDLDVGDTVTVTYSVTVTDPNAELLNVVDTNDERGDCITAADGNDDCITEHPAMVLPGSRLAVTGTDLRRLGVMALISITFGALMLGIERRRWYHHRS